MAQSFTDFSIASILSTEIPRTSSKLIRTQSENSLPPLWTQRQHIFELNPNILRRRYSRHQIEVLTKKYRESKYVSRNQMAELAKSTNLSMMQVKIWFQNRRLKDRKRQKVSSNNDDNTNNNNNNDNENDKNNNNKSNNFSFVPKMSKDNFVLRSVNSNTKERKESDFWPYMNATWARLSERKLTSYSL